MKKLSEEARWWLFLIYLFLMASAGTSYSIILIVERNNIGSGRLFLAGWLSGVLITMGGYLFVSMAVSLWEKYHNGEDEK